MKIENWATSKRGGRSFDCDVGAGERTSGGRVVDFAGDGTVAGRQFFVIAEREELGVRKVELAALLVFDVARDFQRECVLAEILCGDDDRVGAADVDRGADDALVRRG